MAFASLTELTQRLNAVYTARGSLDCLLTVGTSTQVTFFVGNAEPFSIDAPINLKWLKGNTLYVRTSRSQSGANKNTWMPVITLTKALETQVWDRVKPPTWEMLQHVTNIDDPHSSTIALQAAFANLKFVYTSTAPAAIHTVTHNRNTLTPVISIYVDGELSFTEVKILDANSLTVTFPIPENCKVVIT